MHPSLEQVRKILKLEIDKGYPNKAVIGGLPKMLGFWEPGARRAGIDAGLVDAIVEVLTAYPSLSAEDRAASVKELMSKIQGNGPGAARAQPAQAASPSPRTPPKPAETARPSPRSDPVSSDAVPSASRDAAPSASPAAASSASPDAASSASPDAAPSASPAAASSASPDAARSASPDAASSASRDTASAAPREGSPPSARPETRQESAPGARPAQGPKRPSGDKPAPARREKSRQPSGQPARKPQEQHRRGGERRYETEEPLDPRPRRPSGPRPLKSATPNNPNAGIDEPLTVLKGVGPETAKTFQRLGLTSLRDLMLYFPRRYDNYASMKTINRLQLGDECSVIGMVTRTDLRRIRGGKATALKVILSDPTGSIEMTFWNQHWLADKLKPGRQIVVSGRVSQYLGHLILVPEEWEDLDRELLHTGRIVPVYPLTQGMTNHALRKLTAQIVNFWARKQPETLPEEIVQSAEVMGYAETLAQVHYPDSEAERDAALHRLAFDELLLLQLGVLRQRRDWQSASAAPLTCSDEWLAAFTASLPYSLTGAQQRALADLRTDLARGVPMNRLLQGDVGSGKTVVAAAGLAIAAQAGAQAALMAPTSILAEQHYATLSALLGAGGQPPASIRLLQGATPAAEKDEIYAGLRSGEIKIVIGTHALIEAAVEFASLGLVIVDEQHRFGVAQRAALRGKGSNPHLLVMTATPIPRSLALTIYGDLDLSVLDEMPPGRQPVRTYLLSAAERERGYAFVRAQVQKGRQAFFIFPLVEESEKVEAKAAVDEHARLQQEVFAELSLGLLHGRMSADEKDEVMARFRAGEHHILVSTSVVEVGVDVPNASVILIEGANRFGLAQLHQFRGRVGRGEHASYCLLISDAPGSASQADERLRAMEQTQDGFILAEKDLELRGPGEFLGTRQSGMGSLNMARLSDVTTIEKARREARQLFERDPDLLAPEHQTLADRLGRFWAPGGGSGDVS